MAAPTQHAGAAQAPQRSMGDAAPVAAPEGHLTLGAAAGAPAPSRSPGGDLSAAPEPGTLTRLKESVWYKVVGKGLALGALLTALAVIGSWSTLHAKGEPEAEQGSAPAPARDSQEWVRAPEEPSAGPKRQAPKEGGAPKAEATKDRPQPSPQGDARVSQLSEQDHARGGAAHTTADAGAPSERLPGVTPDGKVILNTATAEDFVKLPGVGPSRAEAIVKLRTRLKRFRKVSDLLRVRGIGVRSLKRIQPLVVLDPPPPPAPPSEADAGAAKP